MGTDILLYLYNTFSWWQSKRLAINHHPDVMAEHRGDNPDEEDHGSIKVLEYMLALLLVEDSQNQLMSHLESFGLPTIHPLSDIGLGHSCKYLAAELPIRTTILLPAERTYTHPDLSRRTYSSDVPVIPVLRAETEKEARRPRDPTIWFLGRSACPRSTNNMVG